jgi:CubicO group peptidase (beta-lactamase class C family)
MMGYFVLVSALISSAEEIRSDDAEIFESIDEFVRSEQQRRQLPAISISLVDGDRIVGSRGYGYANASKRAPVTGDTVYRVGSISKLFTDIALMQLVAGRKVNLDADVRTYLPDFTPRKAYGEPITLRQLMSHQSGLVREPPVGNYFDPTEPSLAETVKSLNDVKLVYQPGSRTKYSNAGLAVVGRVIEAVSGESFESYMQEHVLQPMRMTSSSYTAKAELVDRLANGWMWSHFLPRFRAPDFGLGTAPAGNLYSTVDDMSQLLIMVFNDGSVNNTPILPAKPLSEMLRKVRPADADGTNGEADYGIGFRLGELDGRPTFGHAGAVYGFAAQLTGLPNERIGVVVAVALDGANGFAKRLSDYALRLLLARRAGRVPPSVPSTEAVDRPEDMDGTYRAGNDVIVLHGCDDRLFITYDSAINEVRRQGEHYVIDDVVRYGDIVEVSPDGDSLTFRGASWRREVDDSRHSPATERWRGLVGEYGWDHNTLYIFEDRGRLWALIEWFYFYPLTEIADDRFAFPDTGLYHGEEIVFSRDSSDQATQVTVANVVFERRDGSPLAAEQLRTPCNQ